MNLLSRTTIIIVVPKSFILNGDARSMYQLTLERPNIAITTIMTKHVLMRKFGFVFLHIESTKCSFNPCINSMCQFGLEIHIETLAEEIEAFYFINLTV